MVDQLRHTSSHSDARIGHRIAPVDAVFHERRIEQTKRILVSHRPSHRTADEPVQRELSSRVPGGVQRISLSHHDQEYGTTTRPEYISSSIFGRYSTTSRRRDNEALLSKVDCTSHRLAAGPHHGPTIVSSGVHSMNIYGIQFDGASNANLHTVLPNLSHQATSSPGAPV